MQSGLPTQFFVYRFLKVIKEEGKCNFLHSCRWRNRRQYDLPNNTQGLKRTWNKDQWDFLVVFKVIGISWT